MKYRIILFGLVLTLAGCVSQTGGHGSRLLPWNWFSPDSTADVKKQEVKLDATNQTLRKNAQEFTAAERAAIAAEVARQLRETGKTSREIETAREYADEAAADLNQSEGPLPEARIRELEALVAARNSEIAQVRSAGEKALSDLRQIATTAAEDKLRRQKEVNRLHAMLGDELERAMVKEEKYNRSHFIFWAVIIGGLVLYIFGQIATRLAAANPVFAPIAGAFNMVAAPALKASWNKVSDMTDRVGRFMARVRTEVPAAASQVEPLLDWAMDQHQQKAIAAAATSAGAPPK